MAHGRTDPIRFGTDGWRATVGRDFTLSRLRRVVWVACQLLGTGNGPDAKASPGEVIVGHDRRFLARAAAEEAAAVALAAGWRVRLSSSAATTPACCWEVVRRQARGALVITASHNPPEYLGIKIKGPHGGPVESEWASKAEALLVSLPVGQVPDASVAETLTPARTDGRLRLFRPDGAYLGAVRGYAFGDGEEAGALTVAADAMYGAAGSCWHRLLAPLGCRTVLVRTVDNPTLPGLPRPEPLPELLRPLQRAVLRNGADLGVVTDGDGDRIAAVAEDGSVVDAQQTFALLLWYLAEVRGWRGTVVKTYAGTRWIDALAEAYGLPFHETPIGFKHVVAHARSPEFLIGGEEAGGIGVRGHLPERDGLLCGLLLVDLVRRTGLGLTQHLARLRDLLGPSVFVRRDLPVAGSEGRDLLARLTEEPWDELDGEACVGVDTLDGVKFELKEGGWLLVRPSGTEPVVRIYCEGPGELVVRRRLDAAVARVSAWVAS